jgi:hypothetical protein
MGEKLFNLIKTELDLGSSDKDIISSIKLDDELLSQSCSYCRQCGKCEMKRCSNFEVREDGLTYCLLQDNNYPNGKKVASDKDIYDRLDPTEFVKPLVCHTYGPHLVFLAILHYKTLNDQEMVEITKQRCDGALEMFHDYENFIHQLE